MIHFRTAALAAGAALIAASSQPAIAGIRATPEFESGETRPVSIAVLPAETTVVRSKVVDTEALVDESTRLAGVFAGALEETMEAKGYVVEVIDSAAINADPRLQEHVLDANRRFDELRGKVRPRKIKRRAYNAGDEVRLLADYVDVDAVAFSNVSVTITPAGKAIVSALIGGSTSGAYASLALVDGDSGDLEAMTNSVHIVTPGDKTEEEVAEYVATLAERATNDLPAADPSKRIDDTSDEDVLNDIESLLGK